MLLLLLWQLVGWCLILGVYWGCLSKQKSLKTLAGSNTPLKTGDAVILELSFVFLREWRSVIFLESGFLVSPRYEAGGAGSLVLQGLGEGGGRWRCWGIKLQAQRTYCREVAEFVRNWSRFLAFCSLTIIKAFNNIDILQSLILVIRTCHKK